MPTYLEGLAIQFYRGIGPETQYIAPFSDMNIFVGANNAGKSVVLNLIAEHLTLDPKYKPSNTVDAYRGSDEGNFQTYIALAEDTYNAHLTDFLLKKREAYLPRTSRQFSWNKVQIGNASKIVSEQLLYKGGVWLEQPLDDKQPRLCMEVYQSDYDYGLDFASWKSLTKLLGLVQQVEYAHAARGVVQHVTLSSLI